MEDSLVIDHGTLVDWINEADDVTGDSRGMSERCRDYYDSKQLSETEVRALKKRRQAPVVINRVKPKMDGLMGLERQNRTTAKAWPRTPKHDKGAEAATEAIRFCLQKNDYNQVRSSAWDNLLIEGTGAVEVIVKPKGDGFDILLNHIQWDRLIYDPHSRRKDFRDARFKGQVVWMDYDIALAEYPDGKDVLETMFAGSSTYDDKPRWVDGKRKRVKIVELYYIQDGAWYYTCLTLGGYLKQPKKSPYVTEDGESEDAYEFASLFVSRECDRYGAMLQLLDVQDEINKRRSKALHLMSVRQVRLERGAVEDVNKTRQELAKPDGVVETTPGMEFEVLKTGDMAAAQFNLLTEAKQEIDAVSYNAAVSGKDQQAQSGVALRTRAIAGQTEVAPMFDVLKNLDSRVYRKVWNRIKQYWDKETWIRVTDDPSNLRWVGLNQPITKGQQLLEQAQEQGVPPEQLQQMQQQIQMDPAMQEVVDTRNDVANLDVDLVIADAPDAVTQQMEDFQTLGEMVKSGFPMPPLAVIEASPLSNKDRIMKMMKEAGPDPAKLQEQLQTVTEKAQELAQENQTLKADQQGEAAKLQQKGEQSRAELALKAEVQAEEIRLERERNEATIQLEREKAAATLELEAQRADQENRLAHQQMEMSDQQESKKLEFQKQQKLAADPEYKDVAMMPQIMEAIQSMTQGITTGMQQLADGINQLAALQTQSLEAQQQTLEAIKAPKSVSIGAVRKGADGRILGATVNTSVQ